MHVKKQNTILASSCTLTLDGNIEEFRVTKQELLSASDLNKKSKI